MSTTPLLLLEARTQYFHHYQLIPTSVENNFNSNYIFLNLNYILRFAFLKNQAPMIVYDIVICTVDELFQLKYHILL